ncbi:MAG: PD-(D/E)XK nuclease family protein, partial [Pseudomonadales bacterium]|nr:PD-(D/E)XK nuclease family protein [Pseudomonadales bacterium]
RAALATPLLQCTAEEIDALNHNVMDQQRALEEFLDYHHRWANHDIAPMIESLISRRQIAEKWLGHPDGERQLTNLRHLAELLQERSEVAPGMHRLLNWFVRERADAETVSIEERQLRLESDQHLVQIVTMHAAKGLQYDVVMIPMAGFRFPARSGKPVLFHDTIGDSFTTIVDLTPDEDTLQRTRNEELAEDLRLLYVAITRARSKCYIGIPNMADILETAAARLFRLNQTDGTAEAIGHHLKTTFEEPLFRLESVGNEPPATQFDPKSEVRKLTAPPPRPVIRDSWRLHSYTGLTRMLPAGTAARNLAPIAGYGDDDEAITDYRRGGPSRFTFPRGPRAGIVLHELLERMSFQASDSEVVEACRKTLHRIGIDTDQTQWIDTLVAWVKDIVRTPMTEDASAFRLSDIDNDHCIPEMEFHFTIGSTSDLAGLMRRYNYLEELTVPVDTAGGIMTGLIDLVIEHEEQFYLLDYKSNYLGPDEADYDDTALADAITAHHYELQYLLYCVALHRYLGHKLDNYDYDRHFGGVFYLFLRGMTGQSGSGIFHDKPPAELIEQLDAMLGGSS